MTQAWLPPGERILLTGATGQVGGELLKLFTPLSEVVAPARDTLDLTDAASIRRMIRALQPRWIVNTAAYTAVDKAESELQLAFAVNTEAVKAIGEEARAIGARVIHFSTDYVFDGSADQPYRETDATHPASVYGASKLAGEKALADSGARHLIFRTSWVYGGVGRNFLLTILKLAREREVVRVVNDQHGAPTWSRDLARMTVHAIRSCEAAARDHKIEDVPAHFDGIYHAAGAGETTWYGFAAEALRLQREAEPDARLAAIEPITTAEYPTPAKRPCNSRMNCTKLADRFGWTMMDWKESLRKVLSEL
jgi:dTDP-4-dehydrorhamnose reductase